MVYGRKRPSLCCPISIKLALFCISLNIPLFNILCLSFVVDVLKPIFHHDHESLQYDIRFCRHPNVVSHDKFLDMKSDLVHNACVAMPMLMALRSDFQLQTDHLDVFMAMLIYFDFAYILAGANVEQTAMKMLSNTPCFQDDQSKDAHSLEDSTLPEWKDNTGSKELSLMPVDLSGSSTCVCCQQVDLLCVLPSQLSYSAVSEC